LWSLLNPAGIGDLLIDMTDMNYKKVLSILVKSIVLFFFYQSFYNDAYFQCVSDLTDKGLNREWFFYWLGQIILLTTVLFDGWQSGKGWKVYCIGMVLVVITLWLARL